MTCIVLQPYEYVVGEPVSSVLLPYVLYVLPYATLRVCCVLQPYEYGVCEPVTGVALKKISEGANGLFAGQGGPKPPQALSKAVLGMKKGGKVGPHTHMANAYSKRRVWRVHTHMARNAHTLWRLQLGMG